MEEKNAKPLKNSVLASALVSDNTASLFITNLIHISDLLNELGKEFTTEQHRVDELESRFTSARFHLAVLGQFKRGKSTLLNALLGEELLPSSVVPITSIPTFLSWGSNRLIKVIFHDGSTREYASENVEDLRSFLTQHVAETNNPRNNLGVARVEVMHPSLLLKKGVVLIDTPGIGSTFQHNTEATFNFLPQCDGALFLISADPPITQVEIEFLKAVRSRVVRTIFIMNKIDYLSENECHAAIDFFQAVLHEQLNLNGQEPVFAISARRGMESRSTGDDALWIKSGMATLEDYLLKFLTEEKMHFLQLAVAKKAGDVLEDVLLHIRLKQRSLAIPLEDLDQRLAIFNQKLEEVEQQRLLTQDILKGDQKRLIEMLEGECAAIIKEAEGRLFNVLEEPLRNNINIGYIENKVKRRLTEVIPELFENDLFRTLDVVNQRTQKVLGAHREKARTLADIIRRTAAELFELPYIPERSPETIEIRHEPYWVTENWTIALSPLPQGWLERLLPRQMALRRIQKSLQQDIEAIVLRNVGNLRWATLQNIQDTFYRFSLNMDQELKEIANATRGAIQEARTQRIQKAGDVNEEINRLKNFETKFQEIQKEFVR